MTHDHTVGAAVPLSSDTVALDAQDSEKPWEMDEVGLVVKLEEALKEGASHRNIPPLLKGRMEGVATLDTAGVTAPDTAGVAAPDTTGVTAPVAVTAAE